MKRIVITMREAFTKLFGIALVNRALYVVMGFADPIKVVTEYRNVQGFEVPFRMCASENSSVTTVVLLLLCTAYAWRVQGIV